VRRERVEELFRIYREKIVTSVGGKIKIGRNTGNGPGATMELNVVIAPLFVFWIEIFGFELLMRVLLAGGIMYPPKNKRYNKQ